MKLSLPELLMVAQCYGEGRNGITPELMAAICWVESHGDTEAVGDRGRAVGLAQFHACAWRRCSPRDSHWSRRLHRSVVGPCPRDHRLKVDCTMRALVKNLRTGAGALRRRKMPVTAAALARWHNSGRADGKWTRYATRVGLVMRGLKKEIL